MNGIKSLVFWCAIKTIIHVYRSVQLGVTTLFRLSISFVGEKEAILQHNKHYSKM